MKWMNIGGRMKLQVHTINYSISLSVRIENDGRLRGAMYYYVTGHEKLPIAEFFDDDTSDEAIERMKARLVACAVLHQV